MPTVNDIVLEIEKIAKTEYAYDWDNCGLCVGNKNNSVSKVLITLDVTVDVVKEASETGCQMIISHHPLIFKPIYECTEEGYVGEIISLLYKNDIALYSAHTSLDIAFNGVNDALCETLLLKNVSLLAPFNVCNELVACGRVGELDNPMEKNQLLEYVKEKTGAKTLNYYLEDKKYQKIALSTGAGEDLAFEGKEADVFITGEIKYHTALELKRQNISFISAGHYYTEIHFAQLLRACLQKQADMLQYNVTFINSKTNTNPFEN
jgi:dinuclear metal center YbgI/SA1388 family protein